MTMIITCPDCKKKFKIDLSLIPVDGRDLKCGSCEHIWFYKKEDKKIDAISLQENLINNKAKSVIDEEKIVQTIDAKQRLSQSVIDKKNNKTIEKKFPLKNNTSGKFFSYLVVSIISFVALIILVDTFKTPLINVFPDLDIILLNLFEILKDIKLFIIDLS
jgi:predicted Zn finger-like uncharacterized protein